MSVVTAFVVFLSVLFGQQQDSLVQCPVDMQEIARWHWEPGNELEYGDDIIDLIEVRRDDNGKPHALTFGVLQGYIHAVKLSSNMPEYSVEVVFDGGMGPEHEWYTVALPDNRPDNAHAWDSVWCRRYEAPTPEPTPTNTPGPTPETTPIPTPTSPPTGVRLVAFAADADQGLSDGTGNGFVLICLPVVVVLLFSYAIVLRGRRKR